MDMDPDLIDEMYESPDASEVLEVVEEYSDLTLALKALPSRYKEAVILRYSDEFSFEEIAFYEIYREGNASLDRL